MKKTLLFCLIPCISLLTACDSQTDNNASSHANTCFLAGTWVSNKEKTLPALNQRDDLSSDEKQMISDLVGRVSMTFDDQCQNVEVAINEQKQTMSVQAIKKTKNTITVINNSGQKVTQLKLENDCFSIEIDGMNVQEYYCR